jgi:hypothetical protein
MTILTGNTARPKPMNGGGAIKARYDQNGSFGGDEIRVVSLSLTREHVQYHE